MCGVTLRRLLAALVALALVAGGCTAPAAPPPDPGAGRRGDLDALVTFVETTHPAPFANLDEAAWRREVADVRARAGSLTDEEFLVAVARLANLGPRNGHGGVFPTDQRHPMWGLRLYEFADGWRVVGATDRTLIGGRLAGVGGRPVDEVVRALRAVVPYDNAQTVRARLAMYLASPAFLRGLGLLGDGRVRLAYGSGADREVVPPEVPPAEWSALAEVDVPQIPPALPRTDLARTDSWFWSARHQGALVVGYERVVRDLPDGRRVGWLVTRIEEALAGDDPPRVLVVDLRRNPGGDIGVSRPLTWLLRDVARAGRVPVRVLVGRGTYSAASLTFAELRTQAPVRFYGEETSGGLGTYSDPASTTLPASGIVVHVATEYVTGAGRDVPAIRPDVRVPLPWAAYAAGRDPVLAAALR
jgi:hypothetical protein